MKKPMWLMTLLLSLIIAGCAPSAGDDSSEPAVPVRSYASHSTDDVVGYSRTLAVRAEPVWRASIGPLLADPEGGVWGVQDGALFHFQARQGAWIERTTYGRPDAASAGSGELVWLEPGRLLAGRVEVVRLVRLSPDGKLDELGPSRSPAGVPLLAMRRWEGRLFLQDALGSWYSLEETTGHLVPVAEKAWYSDSLADLPEREREALERAASGMVGSFGAAHGANGITYGIVSQTRLFTYDVKAPGFSWLGEPVRPGTLRLLGFREGRILADAGADGLVRIDPQTGLRQNQAPSDGTGLPLLYLGDELVYQGLDHLIGLTDGQTRSLTLPGLSGGITAAVLTGDRRLLVGTGHGGQLISIDLATGVGVNWGRPVPELGQASGEEIAPIDGLALGGDGLLYVVIGSGARGRNESHVVRMDPATGQVVDQALVPETIRSVLTGADGRVYAVLNGRVAVVGNW